MRPLRFHHLLLSIAVAVVASVALASCSSDGDDTATGPDDEAGSTTTTEAPDLADAEPVPSPGCAAPATDEVALARTDLSIGGADRYYLLTTPAPSDGPLPLVVDLHGLMEGAQIHALMTQFGEYGQEQGFVTAFPHGSGEPVRWDAEPASDPNLDLEFLDAMLTQIGEQRCIDTARIYATGLSYGAIMSSFLACERSEVFAAMAPVDGITMPEGCEPTDPMPMLTTHGTEDPILLFNGGVGDLGSLLGDAPAGAPAETTTTMPIDLEGPGYPETVAEWAELNGCEDEFTDTEVTPEVIHRVYDCPADGAVEFYIVVGGGHSWPSSEFSESIGDIVGPTTFDIDATELAWEFFQRFSRS
jgi:polyhydroxybutyrate depolymerase